jgi:hypothetical protein
MQMVQLRGQARQGLGAGGRRAAPTRVPFVVALALVALSASALPARAQSAVGFHGGFAADSGQPEQVFGGVFFQSVDIGRGIRLRPGIDGATGDWLRTATIGLDFVYGYPLNNGWTLIAGGGPAVVITRIPDIDVRDTGVGFHSLFGFGHDNGFFAEVRLGSGRAQQLKVGVGWAIVLD